MPSQKYKARLRIRVPKKCACGFGGLRSPWHCECGRWKRALADVCEVCFEEELE